MNKRFVPFLALAASSAVFAGTPPASTTPAPAPATTTTTTTTTTATTSAATPTPADIVAYRQATMGAAGRHMKLIGLVTKGAIARPQDLPGDAVALRDTAKILADLFPAGSGPDKIKTDALAAIWTNPNDFKTAVTAYQTETQKLVDVVATGDSAAIKAQVAKVGDSCGACHDKFRVKD